jgi:chromosome segregation ATPase
VPVQPKALEIAQTYALRAWTTWLQTQISNAQPELTRQIGEHQRQIGEHEREIARLRATMDRSSTVLKSLQKTIEQLDGILREVHDTDIVNAAMRLLADTQQRQMEHAATPARGDAGVPHDDTRARN